jgi:hypothetical protein
VVEIEDEVPTTIEATQAVAAVDVQITGKVVEIGVEAAAEVIGTQVQQSVAINESEFRLKVVRLSS